MGILPIILASLSVSRRDSERSRDLEDLEKAPGQTEFGGDDDNEDEEKEMRSPGSNGNLEDDNESIHDPDPQDADEDEPEERPTPRRQVTFGNPSGESSPPSERGDAKSSLLARLKAFLFPPRGKDTLANYRVLPIISGLVIPFCILLEIPGLTDSWYIRTDGNVVIETKENPPILNAGLGISMFFAVLANVSLITRFLEKGPVLATTLTTIASLTIHGDVSL